MEATELPNRVARKSYSIMVELMDRQILYYVDKTKFLIRVYMMLSPQ